MTPTAAPNDRYVELSPAAHARVFVGPGRAHETITVPGVVMAAGEALVRVELATICGSDVHTVQGSRTAPVPLVLGHEYVGRVLAVGADEVRDVNGHALSRGDRVVWSILASCGRCDRCARGLPQKCRSVTKYGHEAMSRGTELSGGFATHMLVRAGTAVVRVDEDLAAEALAPLACGTATAWAALAAAEAVTPLAGANVLVTGAGLIGVTACAMATDRGARVVVSDPDPLRRERARRFGAVAAIDPRDDPRDVFGSEITVAVEASGSSAAITGALTVIGVGAALILVGSVFPAPPVAMDAEHLVRNLISVRGVHNYRPDDLASAARWLHGEGRRHPLADLVGAIFSLDELDDALRVAAEGAHVRVGVRPGLGTARSRD